MRRGKAPPLKRPEASGKTSEYTWLLLTAIAGAGLVLIGTRQTVARVVVLAPRPLPDAVVALRLADLRPAVAALALAALASLAAVLATRRLLRRIVALVTAAIAVVIALLTIAAVSPADVLAAARRTTASSAGGAGAGSATAGTTAGSAAEPMTGLPAHVLSQGSGWRTLIVVGAAALLVAAITIVIRAYRLPVMSSRYGTVLARPSPASPGQAQPGSASPGPDSMASPVPAMWEALSAGTDPTAWPGEDDT